MDKAIISELNQLNLAIKDGLAPPAKCWHCKGTRFWRGPGGWLCCRCHPRPGGDNE